MARIAFLLLCHKAPDAVIAQAEMLTAGGDYVAVHYDKRGDAASFQRMREALSGNSNVAFVQERVACGWGEWSLVAATLATARTALDAFERASHLYLISGDCLPIKSASYVHAFLDARDVDYIESVDYFQSDWIKTGMKEERLIYRHFLNERSHKALFYVSIQIQKMFGLERRLPGDLDMMIGSQWWCLRRRTMEAILAFLQERPDVVRFFRRTWIPDETFFQTLVRHLIPEAQIKSRTPTFLMFSDYGLPVIFYNDQYDLLVSQDFLFARKISPHAEQLKERLGALWASETLGFEIADDGRALFDFVTKRGRVGQRFGPRFWETAAEIGQDRTLMILVSKKWHVAKRFVSALSAALDHPIYGYLFSEERVVLPDMGGVETTLSKRHRHRKALLRMIYDRQSTDRLMICLDPSQIDMITEFCADPAHTRVLELDLSYSDAYLRGHIQRSLLKGTALSQGAFEQVLPAVRNEIRTESIALREVEMGRHFRIQDGGATAQNIAALAEFTDLPHDTAKRVLQTPHLFSD